MQQALHHSRLTLLNTAVASHTVSLEDSCYAELMTAANYIHTHTYNVCTPSHQ